MTMPSISRPAVLAPLREQRRLALLGDLTLRVVPCPPLPTPRPPSRRRRRPPYVPSEPPIPPVSAHVGARGRLGGWMAPDPPRWAGGAL